jgi:hypothetical protein
LREFRSGRDDVGVRGNSRGRPFGDHAEAIANIIRMLDADAGFSLDRLCHEYVDGILELGSTPMETLTDHCHEAAARGWLNGVPLTFKSISRTSCSLSQTNRTIQSHAATPSQKIDTKIPLRRPHSRQPCRANPNPSPICFIRQPARQRQRHSSDNRRLR